MALTGMGKDAVKQAAEDPSASVRLAGLLAMRQARIARRRAFPQGHRAEAGTGGGACDLRYTDSQRHAEARRIDAARWWREGAA